jgi:hypothetical protein
MLLVTLLSAIVIVALSLQLFRHYHHHAKPTPASLRLVFVSLLFFGCSGFLLLPMDVSCASSGARCWSTNLASTSFLSIAVVLIFTVVPVSLFFFDGKTRGSAQSRDMQSESMRHALPFICMLGFLLLGGAFADSAHRAQAALLLPLSVVTLLGIGLCGYFTAYGLGAFPVLLILRKPYEESAAGQLQDKLTGEQMEQDELRNGILNKYHAPGGDPFPGPSAGDFEMKEGLVPDFSDPEGEHCTGAISREDQSRLAELRRKDAALRQRVMRLESALGPLDRFLRGKNAPLVRYAFGGVILLTAATFLLSASTSLVQQHFCSVRTHDYGYLPTPPPPELQLPPSYYGGNNMTYDNISMIYNSTNGAFDEGAVGNSPESRWAIAERAQRLKRGAAEYISGSYQSVSNYTSAKLSAVGDGYSAAKARAAATAHSVYSSQAAKHAAAAGHAVSGYLNNAAVYLGLNNTADGVSTSSTARPEREQREQPDDPPQIQRPQSSEEGGTWYTGAKSAPWFGGSESEEDREAREEAAHQTKLQAEYEAEQWCASTGNWNLLDGMLVSLAAGSPTDDDDGGDCSSEERARWWAPCVPGSDTQSSGADALLLLLLCVLLLSCTVCGIADLGIASLLSSSPVQLLLRQPLACCHVCLLRIGYLLCGLLCDLGRLMLPESCAPPDREPGTTSIDFDMPLDIGAGSQEHRDAFLPSGGTARGGGELALKQHGSSDRALVITAAATCAAMLASLQLIVLAAPQYSHFGGQHYWRVYYLDVGTDPYSNPYATPPHTMGVDAGTGSSVAQHSPRVAWWAEGQAPRPDGLRIAVLAAASYSEALGHLDGLNGTIAGAVRVPCAASQASQTAKVSAAVSAAAAANAAEGAQAVAGGGGGGAGAGGGGGGGAGAGGTAVCHMSEVGALFDALHARLPPEVGAFIVLADVALVMAVLVWVGLAYSDNTGLRQQHLDGEYKWFMQVYADGEQ